MSRLPSHNELRELLKKQEDIKELLDRHKLLYEESLNILALQKAGKFRMELPVELESGTGFTAEGVVDDTREVMCHVHIGFDDLWLNLTIPEVQAFTQKRITLLEKKIADLETPIAKLREQHRLVAKTLADTFELPMVTDDTA